MPRTASRETLAIRPKALALDGDNHFVFDLRGQPYKGNLVKAQAEADAYLAKYPQDRAIIERSLAALAARSSK